MKFTTDITGACVIAYVIALEVHVLENYGYHSEQMQIFYVHFVVFTVSRDVSDRSSRST